MFVDNGLAGKSLGLGKNDNGNAGFFYAWFLAPKIKFCSVIKDYGVISVKRSFEGYSEKHWLIKLDDCI